MYNTGSVTRSIYWCKLLTVVVPPTIPPDEMTDSVAFIQIRMPQVAMAQSPGQDHSLGSAFYPCTTRQI
jgi:hypothetical protein